MTTSKNEPPAGRGKKPDQSEVESNAQHEARRRALLSRPLPFSEFRPLSAIVQVMRKTQQTSLYLDRLGPFFVGRAVWQTTIDATPPE